MAMWKIWVIAAGLFLILESITTGFLVFWFAVGSVIAMIVSFFTENIIIQTATFVISSTILIFATRKLVNYFLKNDRTNYVNSLVGKIGRVTVAINPIEGQGQVKINGETWSAVSESNENIETGTEVIITNITGVKAVVKPK